jgi:hypothetical protein
MTPLMRYLSITAVAVFVVTTQATAQSHSGSCLPIDVYSRSMRDDFAMMASDTTAGGAERRALYHLPLANDQQVVQETADALCSRAIDAIRTYVRDDGTAPSQIYLFRVKDVWVVTTNDTGLPFVGVVWVFDASLRKFLGGVLQ